MAVKIRLRRMGQKKAPYYRIVVADSRSKRDGRCIEEIGTYDPNQEPSVCKVDEEAAKKWRREIGQDTESFNSALRAILRQDPDVILVGEMRDPETISIALTAAETGHLVFSTLHTVGAAKTIDRIVDMFPSEQQQQVRTQLSTVCEGVVSQQLIKTIDGRKRVAALEVIVANPAIVFISRSEEHTSDSSHITNSYAVFCLKKKKKTT